MAFNGIADTGGTAMTEPERSPSLDLNDAAVALRTLPYGGIDDSTRALRFPPAVQATVSPVIVAIRWGAAMFGMVFAAIQAAIGDTRRGQDADRGAVPHHVADHAPHPPRGKPPARPGPGLQRRRAGRGGRRPVGGLRQPLHLLGAGRRRGGRLRLGRADRAWPAWRWGWPP